MRLEWSDYDGSPEAREFVDGYLSKWENYRDHGFGVEFGGSKLGIGKTFAATHIGKEMVKRRQKVFFISFVEMAAAFQREDADQMEDKIRMSPYLILDDIMPPVSDKQKDFYHMRFEAIVRHRTNYNLPTIITTNISTEKLEALYPRTYSLLAAKQERIDMDGEDFRGYLLFENKELIANGEARPIT
jgi:DNA replication protein DnaC